MSKKNATTLWPLIQPEGFREIDVQLTIEAFWPCTFLEYKLVDRDQIRMPKEDWRPDILACHDEKSLLVVEVKGKPPSGTKMDAVKQVVGYATQFHDAYPDYPVRVLVIGPYRVKKNLLFEKIEYDGYEVGIINLQNLGRYLVNIATNTMLWQAQNPFGWKPLIGVDPQKWLTAHTRNGNETEKEGGNDEGNQAQA